jgi:nucleolar MIF4G domain-containing protein 1
LRITLADLRSAETRGKWWLVGAAWNGDTLVDRRTKVTEVDGGTRAEANENDALVKLARKQGMNTEIRRAVFVVLMSSDVSGFSIPPSRF